MNKIDFLRTHTTEVRFGGVVESLREILSGERAIVFIDAEVEAHHNLSEHFEESIVVPGGEENKNLELLSMIWSELVDSMADRSTVVVAVGGGVVCDMVAFAAATFMRGVRCVLVPTTLLAQVDAAIGGKCGINFGGYKNMVGSFAPADFVVCDVGLLDSLPQREFRSGLAEMIKAAIIGDEELFELFERSDEEMLLRDKKLLSQAIAASLRVKSEIILRDPYEKGERRVLNLGHTMAHAIESLVSEYTHGEAVAVGLVWAAGVAVERGLLPIEEAERIRRVVEKYALPSSVSLPEEELQEAMLHDKKSGPEGVKIVLPERIGSCRIESLRATIDSND